MKTLRITFSNQGCSFGQEILDDEFSCSVQNCLVNIASHKGEDGIFPDKGTGLTVAALNGALFDEGSSNHQTTLAALQTLMFFRTTDYSDSVEKLSNIIIKPATFENARIELNAQFVSSSGRISGTSTTFA